MTRKIVEVLLLALALAFAWLSVDSWLASRDAQRQFKTAFAVEQKLIAESDVTKRQQENALTNLLREIENLKEKTRTPSQVVKELPKYLPLPAPITISRPQQDDCVEQAQGTATTTDSAVSRNEPSIDSAPSSSMLRTRNLDAKLPVQDLRPLFDFVQDCRTCDAELDAARKKAAEDTVKITALTRERDLAIRAKTGSLWLRIRQDAILFGFGAIAGYAAIH
ncbi:MAG TPA: hypothetical protein VJS43_10965 [Candidatus Acidoferrales bacterium]|nr:hypothetical protein [Candidatus Acidoferrales bacterium]